MSRQRLLILTAFTLLLLPTLTLACGGFFCTTTPIDQSAERIIFLVNDDETITAIVGINYTGAAEDFSWVVPVPSPPVLDVAETASLDTLEAATAVQITDPPNYCDGLYLHLIGFGGGGGSLEQGNVGPYDYAIIRNEDPAEMITWLRDNGYQITPEMEPLIAVYVEEGMYFLAMKLSQDAEVGDIQPVVMTYESTKPMIPIRLTAVAAVQDMPIITWIFANTQYAPENYAHIVVDFSTYRGSHQLADLGSFGLGDITNNADYFSAFFNLYRPHQARVQREFNGLAFITEYAGPTADLPDAAQDDLLLSQLIDRYPYMTRLRAQMSPEQMTLDPTFLPAPDAPDVSNIVNLEEWVNSLEYWGCSTRTILSNDMMANGPEAHTRIDALHLDAAHPPDWILSEFQMNEQPVWVLAPEAVNQATLDAFIAGKRDIPMLVIAYRNTWQDLDFFPPDRSPEYDPARPRAWPFSGTHDDELPGLQLGILADQAGWESNGALYDAMLAYAVGFQYYLHPDFRHTLFLTDEAGLQDAYSSFNAFETINTQIPYPEGWIEQVKTDGEIVLMPENAAQMNDEPFLRLIPVERFTEPEIWDNQLNWPAGWQPAADWMTDQYELTANMDWHSALEGLAYCDVAIAPLAFERGGRMGYVRFTHRYIVAVSAPQNTFSQHDTMLTTMIEALISETEWDIEDLEEMIVPAIEQPLPECR